MTMTRIELGQTLAEYRRQHNMTVRELADISGISYQNITKIEHGKYNVSIDILNRICQALGVRIAIMR